MEKYVIPEKGGNCTSHKDFKRCFDQKKKKIYKVLYIDENSYKYYDNTIGSILICEDGHCFYERYVTESTKEAYEKQEGIFKKPKEDLTYLVSLLKTLE